MSKSTICAGCRKPATEGVRLIIALEVAGDYAGRSDLELGQASAPVHPAARCIEAACAALDARRDLSRALEAARAEGIDRLSILLEAR